MGEDVDHGGGTRLGLLGVDGASGPGMHEGMCRMPGIDVRWTAAGVADATVANTLDPVDVVVAWLAGLGALGEVQRIPGCLLVGGPGVPAFRRIVFALGARGVLAADATPIDIAAAALDIKMRGILFTRRELDLWRQLPWRRLTHREHEVLTGVVLGHSNGEIAAGCHVSIKAVEAIVTRLMRRLEVTSRTALAVTAERDRLLDAPVATDPFHRTLRRPGLTGE